MNMFSSHESQNYDKTLRQVIFEVRDSARLRTRPRSEACARFTAKLAPLFKGPYRAEQVMSDLNPKLSRVSDDSDRVHHDANLIPFFTWGEGVQNPPSSTVESVPDQATGDDGEEALTSSLMVLSRVDLPSVGKEKP